MLKGICIVSLVQQDHVLSQDDPLLMCLLDGYGYVLILGLILAINSQEKKK